VEMSLEPLPAKVNHTMCFLGVGDHGGGPNEAMIEWVRANRDAIPNARLEFSSPERFFRALQPELKHLPFVTGELQMHAIGCYTGHRPVKTGVRRAENMLALAGRALAQAAPADRKSGQAVLDYAWRTLCFNSFHDTLGGSCTPSAARAADDQLAGAKAAAETVLSEVFRKKAHALPADKRQRIVLANNSGEKFSDFIEHEPWLEWTHWKPDWCLLNEKNQLVPYQVIEPETLMPDTMRILFPATVDAGKFHTLRIARNSSGKAAKLAGPKPDFTLTVAPNGSGTLQPATGILCSLPELKLIEEKSDTWSHGLDRFAGPQLDHAHWSAPVQVENGPIRSTWRIDGTIGSSRICADWRRYAGHDFYELRLRVTWNEHHKLLRLSWSPGAGIASREDGIPGGGLPRASDGRELPLRDRSLLLLDNGTRAGLVAPEVFAISGDTSAAHLTLLRSCPFAHHDPKVLPEKLEHYAWQDQGEHTFLFRFFPAGRVSARELDRHAHLLQQRPTVADLTRGMPERPYKDEPKWPA